MSASGIAGSPGSRDGVRVQQVGQLPDAVGESRRRPRVVARRRRPRPPTRPVEARRTRSGLVGVEAARADDDELRLEREHLSQVVENDGCPAPPSTSTPPASSIISGSQCPAQNGGSIHSAKKTRRRGRPRTERPPARPSLRMRVRDLSPRRATPSRAGEHPTEAATSSNVRGSSEITSAPTGHADASSPLDTAHTAHRSCVTITSGASSAISSASTVYSERPSRNDARTASSISSARQLRRIDPCRRHDRQADDLGRPATLLRDADERVDQPELGDDLGCTREERADPHRSRPYPCKQTCGRPLTDFGHGILALAV